MPSSQAQAPGGFVSDVSSNAYNYAMGAVGTIAGPKTRRRVESSVDSLSSGKLYHLYFLIVVTLCTRTHFEFFSFRSQLQNVSKVQKLTYLDISYFSPIYLTLTNGFMFFMFCVFLSYVLGHELLNELGYLLSLHILPSCCFVSVLIVPRLSIIIKRILFL